ncbi:uncharacterized protein LOC109831208 [Asparagus officinalis]|uniref:uncharacterized protein LOC109831208 n=1 Tax=Asparagus officinalis TaxID=4686 RepID=UPI00098E6441|nr:uncharacterized protein LOC109831208 [Asparagus officinalis]
MASGKFLGFVVTANGIRLDPDKVKAIQELPPPRNLKELEAYKDDWRIFAVKGRTISDLMANHPLKEKAELYQDIPDETYEANVIFREQVWQLYFDGATSTSSTGRVIAGVVVVFISPQNHILSHAVSLTEPCSNNVAEYNTLLVSLDIAKQLGVKHLETYGDSQLIVNQMKGEYEVRNEYLIPYLTVAIALADSFEGFYIDHIPRLKNTYADALASLAATLALPESTTQQINAVEEEPAMLEPKDWRFLIIDYVLYSLLPEDIKERESIRRRAPRFYYDSQSQTLYRKSYDGLLLRCLSNREAKEALEEAHDGICGAHQSGPKLWDQLCRLGYYWPNMVQDAVAYAKRFHACQIHVNYMHRPPEHLHLSTTSWPFETWVMDIVGPVTPPSSKGHRFILAITDYFSKWAETIPLREVKTTLAIGMTTEESHRKHLEELEALDEK